MDWKQLESACAACRKCPLWETRTQTVFGTGNRDADLLFVGEAPGAREDETGVPFVGAAGKLLDSYFQAVGLQRSDVYIANILKCRPPQNRDPLPAEEYACLDYLRDQIRLINPKIIVCLGRIAAMRLIREDYRITQEHGTMVKKGPFLMTAVYHPAALLRDPRKKEDMYRDMKAIKEAADRLSGKTDNDH